MTGTPTSKHAFVGQLGHPSEDETGLIYMRARYYDPVAGRFASEDPGKNGANWFWYCDANPVNMADRTGRLGELIEFALLLAVCAAMIAFIMQFLGSVEDQYLSDPSKQIDYGRAMANAGWAALGTGVGAFVLTMLAPLGAAITGVGAAVADIEGEQVLEEALINDDESCPGWGLPDNPDERGWLS